MRIRKPEALSNAAALVGTIVVGAAMLTWHTLDPPSVAPTAAPPTLSLVHEDTPPQPPAAPPPPLVVPRPLVRAPSPAAAIALPDLVMVPVEQAASDPGAVTVSVPAAAPAAAKESSASIEAAYAAALRTNIDSRTTSPSGAEYRLLKPHGSARVSFTLSRDGATRIVSVAQTSGSGILDRQAVTIVQLGHYPPFPEKAFPGEASHVFIVTIEFQS